MSVRTSLNMDEIDVVNKLCVQALNECEMSFLDALNIKTALRKLELQRRGAVRVEQTASEEVHIPTINLISNYKQLEGDNTCQ